MKRQDTLDDAASADQIAETSGQELPQDPAGDAEDGAASTLAELTQARERIATLQEGLSGAQLAHQSAAAEADDLRLQLDAARTQARDAARKYREARLSAMPEIPPEIVPESDDILEIERGLETARRLVVRVRESVQEEARTARVPAGAPPRRAPDISSLSAAEKIRLGLEQLSEKSGR